MSPTKLAVVLLLIFSCAGDKIIRIKLKHHKSMRQFMVESGIKVSTLQRALQAQVKADSDSIALTKYLDNEFYGEVKIGQPAQSFNVIFDTAWANAFVPSSKCNAFDPVCYLHNKYDSSLSSTYIENGQEFNQLLPHGQSLKGFFSLDKINFAHLTVKNFTFAEITSLPLDFLYLKADGVFGMAFESLVVGNATPFFYRLWKDGIISKPIFSVYFNRDPTTPRGGSLFLGGSDSKHFSGNFTFVPLTQQSYWQLQMDRVEINIKTKNITKITCPHGCDAILDTGTQNIQASPADIQQINSLISAVKLPFIGSYVVPCNIISKLPEISFIFANQKFMINSDQYIKKMTFKMATFCVSAFIESESSSNNLWVIGGAFMAKYYTEFNMEKNVVGFAKANV